MVIRVFIGSPSGEVHTGDPRPPKSARRVASIGWSWGPANSRSETYLLSSDRARSCWTLWSRTTCEVSGKRLYGELATATPYVRGQAAAAASQLLVAAWKAETEHYSSDLRGPYVYREGLLKQAEVDRIADAVYCSDPAG